jgi:hypothetical protein
MPATVGWSEGWGGRDTGGEEGNEVRRTAKRKKRKKRKRMKRN